MKTDIFINNAINDSFKLYMDSIDNKDSLNYNRFLCSIVRMLKIIYGEDELIESYKNKDDTTFLNLLTKYGLDNEEVSGFLQNCDKFYNFDKRQVKKAIKKKNKYFNLVQKYLIDMMVKKNEVEKVDMVSMQEFYDLLFTARSKDFYRKSTALLLAYNPYEIDDYFKKNDLKIVG